VSVIIPQNGLITLCKIKDDLEYHGIVIIPEMNAVCAGSYL